ncbi:hypothetical protein CXIVA_05390 [Clostridium sp. SY8519]|nr:hypothetical protein CXIVA_05390 [Clostridium sp. SY8519]
MFSSFLSVDSLIKQYTPFDRKKEYSAMKFLVSSPMHKCYDEGTAGGKDPAECDRTNYDRSKL